MKWRDIAHVTHAGKIYTTKLIDRGGSTEINMHKLLPELQTCYIPKYVKRLCQALIGVDTAHEAYNTAVIPAKHNCSEPVSVKIRACKLVTGVCCGHGLQGRIS